MSKRRDISLPKRNPKRGKGVHVGEDFEEEYAAAASPMRRSQSKDRSLRKRNNMVDERERPEQSTTPRTKRHVGGRDDGKYPTSKSPSVKSHRAANGKQEVLGSGSRAESKRGNKTKTSRKGSATTKRSKVSSRGPRAGLNKSKAAASESSDAESKKAKSTSYLPEGEDEESADEDESSLERQEDARVARADRITNTRSGREIKPTVPEFDQQVLKIRRRNPNSNKIEAEKPRGVENNGNVVNGKAMDEEISKRARTPIIRKTSKSTKQKTTSKSSNIQSKAKVKAGLGKAIDVINQQAKLQEKKKNVNIKDKFDLALNHLQENYVPPRLPCRDQEKKTIREFIESGLINKGNSQTLCKQ